MTPTIATIGSHSALQILKGAKQEGLKTILLCLRKREGLYARYKIADETIIIDKVFPNMASGSTKPGTKKMDVMAGDECATRL